MSKELEDYIDNNRRSFDHELPGDETWNRIEQGIRSKATRPPIAMRTILRWSAAAAILLLAATTIFLLLQRKEAGSSSPAMEIASKENDIRSMAPEHAAEATRIFQSIEQTQQALRVAAEEQPALYHQFAEDLRTLDSSYRVLHSQALRAPNREIIIRAMMQNLQFQAELLHKQLQIIQQFNNDKRNEKATYRPA